MSNARLPEQPVSPPLQPSGAEVANDAARLLTAVAPLLRRFGITRVGDLTDLDVVGIPVAFASRPNSRSLSVSQGKSLDPVEARLGAVMEALEQALAERDEDFVVARCTASALRAQGRIATDLSLLSRVACPPREDRVVAWSEVRSLITGERSFAPFELVGLDLRADRGWDVESMPVSSLGLAAGPTWELAAIHAVLEAIEHNATAALDVLGFAPFLAHPITHRAGGDLPLDIIIDRVERAGLTYHLYDVSPPASLPVLAATITCEDLTPKTIRFAGFACRFSPEDAAEAALLEAVQSRLTFIAGARDDLRARDYDGCRARVASSSRATPLEALPHDFAHLRRASAGVRLQGCVAAALELGATDIHLSRLGDVEDLASVVRVLVPGLEASGFNTTAKLGRRTITALLAGARS